MSRTDGTLADRERWHDEQLARGGAQRRDQLIVTARLLIEHEWRESGSDRPMRYSATWQMEQYELPHQRVTLRVNIRRDTFLGLSFIKVERLGAECWHEVTSIPPEVEPALKDLSLAASGERPTARSLSADELDSMRSIAGEALVQACLVVGLLEVVNCWVQFNAEIGRAVSTEPDDSDSDQ